MSDNKVVSVEDYLRHIANERNPHKLTNWKKEPTASELLTDLRNAKPYHDAQTVKVQDWLDLLNTSPDKRNLKVGRSGVAPKVIRRLSEWRCAALTSSFLNEKSLFKVKATAPSYVSAAIQNELVLNYQFNYLINKVKFINDYIRTAQSEGSVCVRVGWEEQFQVKEWEEPIIEYAAASPEEAMMLQQAIEIISQEQEQAGLEDAAETESFQQLDETMQESVKASVEYGQPVIAQISEQMQTVKENLQVKNRPAVEVIDSRNLVVDPTCDGDLAKAKFVVYAFETDLSTLKAAGIYKNLDKIYDDNGELSTTADLIANMDDEIFTRLAEGTDNISAKFRFHDKPRKKIQAYEYWGYYDIDGTGIVQSIVATICNNTVIRMERNPFPDNEFPFVIVPYLPVKGSVYGQPDAELISDNQQIIQALMRSMIDINARSANGQTAMPKGFLDPINAKKFSSGMDYEYNPLGVHPSEAIFMHTANEIPQSILALTQAQFAEAEAATGIKAFQNGIDGNAYGQTKAGMSQAVSALTQRESDIIFRLAKGLEDIGSKIVAMNAVWLNDEEVVEITDNNFATIDRENLSGDFRLRVDIKSNSESEGKAQQLTFLMQTLGNNIPFEMTKLFLVEISRLYGLDVMTTALQKYEPEPSEAELKAQELEMALQEAKVQKEQAEVAYYQARAEYIQAQIPNVEADTDLKALDFMEQQEGVKHERQKEIVEAQARAQNEGKIATERLRGLNAEQKAMLDNRGKQALERVKQQSNPKFAEKTKKSPTKRGVPNPLSGTVPDGLMKVDGLGNYIKGDELR